MQDDPLADLLRSVRLTGGLFLDARFTAPWCVTAGLTAADVRGLIDDPVQLLCYHVVTRGRLLVFAGGAPPVEVREGEIVLLPRNDGHVLASGSGLRPVPAAALIRPGEGGGLASLRHGGGGEATHIVCGFLGSAEGYNPLIAALPPVLALDIGDATARDWIEASVRFAARELAGGRLASADLVSRLSETLLVEAVRRYSATLPEGSAGWLRGLRDPQVGRALALIHRDLAAPWTPEALAREVAMSRSAFVERFTAAVGLPPIRYLTLWRMQTAKLLLKEPRASVAAVAHKVGYGSEEAFSRAFRRETGLPPSRWRERES